MLDLLNKINAYFGWPFWNPLQYRNALDVMWGHHFFVIGDNRNYNFCIINLRYVTFLDTWKHVNHHAIRFIIFSRSIGVIFHAKFRTYDFECAVWQTVLDPVCNKVCFENFFCVVFNEWDKIYGINFCLGRNFERSYWVRNSLIWLFCEEKEISEFGSSPRLCAMPDCTGTCLSVTFFVPK